MGRAVSEAERSSENIFMLQRQCVGKEAPINVCIALTFLLQRFYW